MVMASFGEGPTSLDEEEAFIADTSNVARLFFKMQYRQKRDSTKGVGSSRPDPSPAVADEVACLDDETARAAMYVGQRLSRIANGDVGIVERAFDRYIEGVTQTIYDINYDTFEIVMTDVISTHQDQFDQIVLTFAGALHISQALREVGNDPDRQEQYTRYVGRFIVERGLMPVVDRLGGWLGIGQNCNGASN